MYTVGLSGYLSVRDSVLEVCLLLKLFNACRWVVTGLLRLCI